MSTLTLTATQVSSYAPPMRRDALNAECLARIITGRALPDGLVASTATLRCPDGAPIGMERVLRGLPSVI